MVLVLQYYQNPKRQDELDFCLRTNINNTHIDNIILLLERDIDNNLTNHPKIHKITIGKRMTYKDAFDVCNEFRGKVCIVANADIYFTRNIRHVTASRLDGQAYCVSRHEEKSDALLSSLFVCPIAGCSQDVWIIKPPLPDKLFADIPLGFPGCDNRIAYELNAAGLRVTNPCLTVIVGHRHKKSVHGYDPEHDCEYGDADRIHGETLFVPATHIMVDGKPIPGKKTLFKGM